jgi:hypothetical protein
MVIVLVLARAAEATAFTRDYRALELGRDAARSLSSGAGLCAHVSSAPDRHMEGHPLGAEC